MRFSLKISIRSTSRRPRHLPLVSGLLTLSTLAASGLVLLHMSADPVGSAGGTPRQISAKDVPALRSEAPASAKLDIPQGDFSNPSD